MATNPHLPRVGRVAAALAVLTGSLALTACASAGDRGVTGTAPSTVEPVVVTIESSRFVERNLEVTAGTTVRFRNLDPFEHTVTAVDDADTAFASELLGPGDEFSVTFDDAGAYDYFCVVHPTMRGTVVVLAAP